MVCQWSQPLLIITLNVFRPSTVSHDHSYLSHDLMSHDKPICIKQEVRCSKERKEETKETEKETKKGNERVDDRVCLLCTSKGDQPSLVS